MHTDEVSCEVERNLTVASRMNHNRWGCQRRAPAPVEALEIETHIPGRLVKILSLEQISSPRESTHRNRLPAGGPALVQCALGDPAVSFLREEGR